MTLGLRKAGPILIVMLFVVLALAWWDGGERQLTTIEQPVELPPGLTGDLAEGQE